MILGHIHSPNGTVGREQYYLETTSRLALLILTRLIASQLESLLRMYDCCLIIVKVCLF